MFLEYLLLLLLYTFFLMVSVAHSDLGNIVILPNPLFPKMATLSIILYPWSYTYNYPFTVSAGSHFEKESYFRSSVASMCIVRNSTLPAPPTHTQWLPLCFVTPQPFNAVDPSIGDSPLGHPNKVLENTHHGYTNARVHTGMQIDGETEETACITL